MKRVGIIDYGLGNIHSVQNAFRRIGAEPTVVCDAAGVEEAHHLVLPGVGAFAEGMRGLRERGLFDAIRSHAARERPLLGICLGMQLLLDGSEEFGSHEGLGIISGRVRLIDAGVKVPHVGWARLQRATEDAWDGTLLAGTSVDSYTYSRKSTTDPTRCAPPSVAVRWSGLSSIPKRAAPWAWTCSPPS